MQRPSGALAEEPDEYDPHPRQPSRERPAEGQPAHPAAATTTPPETPTTTLRYLTIYGEEPSTQSRPPHSVAMTERAPRETRPPQAGTRWCSTGRRMCGCVSTSGKYVLHQRQFWHMQRLQGASSMYQGGCYQTGASNPGILSALLHQRANVQRLPRGTSSRQVQLQTNSPL